MLRNASALMLLAWLAITAAPARADNWAAKMFEATSHDFGTVARGSKAVCSFRLKNIYKETVHIVGVKSSCNCTTPTIEKDTIATYESGEIIAQLNTRNHLGHKTATITVTFDRPYPAEVQLRVEGMIRSDVVLTPGAVQFGTVEQGSPTEQRVTVSYAGRDEWQILDVQSISDHYEVEMAELSRGGGRVNYELLVRLKNSAPAGYLNDELLLITNDAAAPRIPLGIEGKINSDLTVSPASLYLGQVPRGQKVTKKFAVRSKQPIKILNIDCDDPHFDFAKSDEARSVHMVEVTFIAEEIGEVEQKIQIVTDHATASVVAHATVNE